MNDQQKNLPDVKELRRELRNHGTAAEATLWRMLKSRQLAGFLFRRQFSVGSYVMDFYCPAARLAVELDGAPHFTPQGAEYDQQRTHYLSQVAGIRVLRFENRMVFEQTENVLREIAAALGVTVELLRPAAPVNIAQTLIEGRQNANLKGDTEK